MQHEYNTKNTTNAIQAQYQHDTQTKQIQYECSINIMRINTHQTRTQNERNTTTIPLHYKPKCKINTNRIQKQHEYTTNAIHTLRLNMSVIRTQCEYKTNTKRIEHMHEQC